jgi:hypothetical protein
MITPTPEPTHWAQLLVPALFGLTGTLVGGWITAHNQTKDRLNRRYAEQLLFYAEMLSIRKTILAKSEIRLRLHNIMHKVLQEEAQLVRLEEITPQFEKKQARLSDEYDKLIDYSDNQLRNELIPLYRKMVDVWVANMGQAKESTQEHFAALVEYVEIWNRFLDQSLPNTVVRRLEHEEPKLYPLYKDIEEQVVRLRKEIV